MPDHLTVAEPGRRIIAAAWSVVLPILATAGVVWVDQSAHAAKPGRVCTSAVIVGTGNHKTRPVARKLALRDWYDQVTANHGRGYAKWGWASPRNISCNYAPVPGKLPWTCRARGRPCQVKTRITPHQPGSRHPAKPQYRRPGQ